jgi:hypothetical protein
MAAASSFRRVLVIVVSLMTLGIGATSCGGGGRPSPAPASVGGPEGRIASNPLSILSLAGGSVKIRKSGSDEWVDGKIGMTLDSNSTIKTGSDASAAVTFFEGTTIEISEGTELTLADLGMGKGKATSIRLKQEVGKTISKVKKLTDPASKYEIETAACVAAVRGTTLSVEVKGDGTTIVGNIQGSVAVIARGVEVTVPEGRQSVVVPGNAPGPPVSLESPVPPSTTPTALVPTTPGSTAISTIGPSSATDQPVSQGIELAYRADRSMAFPGDRVVCTYVVSNAGGTPVTNTAVSDDKAGAAAYENGDTNGNGVLDVGEGWQFKAAYVVGVANSSTLTSRASVSGLASGRAVTASATVTIQVTPLVVKITSLRDGDIVGRTLKISGTVNDPSVTQATLTTNGTPISVAVAGGAFTATVTLIDGTNNIGVTVTKAAGVVAGDTLILEPTSRP